MANNSLVHASTSISESELTITYLQQQWNRMKNNNTIDNEKKFWWEFLTEKLESLGDGVL